MSKMTTWEIAEQKMYAPKKKQTAKSKRTISGSALAKREMQHELRTRFLIDVHEGVGSADKSVRALKYFCNCLGKRAGKNTAGGARFCNKWEDAYMREECKLIADIINPVSSIAYILNNNRTLDFQLLEEIRYHVIDLHNAIAPSILSLKEFPFYKQHSGFMDGAGHCPAFKDIMIQLLVDANNGVYQDLANRIDSLITKGNDAFSYFPY